MTTIVITGASRGIGWTTTQQLAARGATVFAGARSPQSVADRLEADSSRHGGQQLDIRRLRLDVTNDGSVQAAVRQVEETVGSIDVLINNAGIPGPFTSAEDVVPADFDAVLATNLLGPVRVTHAFLPLLRRSDRARLVMVSSGMGSLTRQSTDEAYATIAHLPYPATKAALNMLTVQYAKALPDVLVTAVDPGLTATEFTGGSGHKVEDGAEVVVTAALDTTGPSGRFIDRHGVSVW